MFHGHGFRAGLFLKAVLANLANKQGNINIIYQSKTHLVKMTVFHIKGETNNSSDFGPKDQNDNFMHF